MKQLFSSRREIAVRLLLGAARALLTAVLAGAQIFGGYAPFAVGAAAAAGGGWEGVAALLGAALGAVLLLDFSHALRFVACCVLLFTANNAFCELRAYRRPWFLPAMTAVLTLAVEAIYALRSGSAAEAAACLVATALAALSAHSFRLLRAPGAGRDYPAAALTLLLGVLMALSGPQMQNGFAPGRILSALAVLLLAFERDAASALTSALCIGLGMDLSAPGQSFPHTACYGFAALMTALLHRDSRVRAALLYSLSTAFFALPLRAAEGLVLLYEGLAGTLVFLLLPSSALRLLRESEPESAPAPEDSLRRRLKAAAAGLRELYDSVSRTPDTAEENPAVLFDRAAERVCRDCSLREYCWEKEYSRTYTALNDATAALLRRGAGRGEDFPSYFSDRCIRFSGFLDAVNRELSAFLLRRQYRSRLSAAYAREARQYASLSELLDDAAERPAAREAMASAPAMTYRLGSSLRPKAGENVSGDCAAGFETESGELCLLLSDGMGSGEEARRESALAARLLERFLRSGIDALPALRTLNGAMNLRAETSGGFATVDLLTLRLRDGEAVLYKYGAAPSYIKRDERVYRVSCAGLPAGLAEEGAAPESTRLRLEGGSFFVMITDGVADSADDGWLQDLLADWQGDDPRQLAAAILADSAERRGSDDDAGVLALYLPPSADEGLAYA